MQLNEYIVNFNVFPLKKQNKTKAFQTISSDKTSYNIMSDDAVVSKL